ncbi:AMP-binding protein [Streptomyces sp. NPDC005708]|uniref:AMP-binding protein n=1 Tax=Streptomyces sp. NPDC005708 TaxID=3154564 RepID=UPI0033C47549
MTHHPRPNDRLILPLLVADRARTTPEAPFLIDVGGDEYSYARVHRESLRWAAALHQHGVRRGDRIAVMVPTSADSVLPWLGAAHLGAINVPLNTSYRGALLEHALRLTAPSLLVIDARLLGSLSTVDSAVVPPLVVRVVDGAATDAPSIADFLATGATQEQPVLHDPVWSDTATLMFTSGTTGPSKAVVMPWLHLHQSSEWVWQTRDAGPGDRNYIPWPTNHISGVGGVYAMAIVGGAAVLRERWSTTRFMDDVYDHRCTMTTLMGAMADYVDHLDLPADRGPCPLERIFVAPVTARTQPLMDRLGAVYCTDYNATELSGPIVSHHHDPVPVGSAGLARPGVELRIVDADGRDLPTGQPGELLVRTPDSAAMNNGYWAMPEATEKAWQGGWFHTGDLLRTDADGYFYYVGRMKDVIRVRGENVSAHELEMVVNGIAGVRESAAIGEPDPVNEENIVLHVVTTPDGPSPEELLASCRELLPRFMVPQRIVLADDLPKTPTGKVQKELLRSAHSPQ